MIVKGDTGGTELVMNADPMPAGVAGSARPRRRIGLLLTRPDMVIDGGFLRGVVAAAVEAEMEVLCFAGGPLSERTPAHAVFSLAGEVPLDGFAVTTAIGHLALEEEVRAFCSRYAGVPVVTGALGLAEFPSVATASFTGFYDIVSHLIEVHECRRIAYIEGPSGQPEAAERFRAYRTALEDHGIAFDAGYVTPGNFVLESGVAAMGRLLERFWSNAAGLALDAVVAANDEMAVGAHQVLAARGVHVPGDVALVGFDDAWVGRSLVPSLTTVRQSFEVVGREAVSILIRMMDGETLTGLQTVPSEVILRRSCGCMPSVVARAASKTGVSPQSLPILTEGEEAAASALWLALLQKIGAGNSTSAPAGDFLTTVETQLRDLYMAWGDPEGIHDRLSLVRRRLLAAANAEAAADAEPGALSPAQVIDAEDLLHQARILTGDIGRRIEGAWAGIEARRAELLHEFDTAISSAIDLPGLVEPVERFFPESHIRELYVVLQESGAQQKQELSPDFQGGRFGAEISSLNLPEFSQQRRLVLRYREGRAETMNIGFTAPRLLPDLIDAPGSTALVTMPLLFRDRLFGYVLISYVDADQPSIPGESEASRSFIYRRIAEELSSAVYRIQLLGEAEAARLQAEVSLSEIRLTRQIADRVRRAPDAEAILRVALEELSGVLGTPRAVVRLGTGTAAPDGSSASPNAVSRDVEDA